MSRNMNHYDNNWKYNIQPALQKYYEKHGNLWSVTDDEPIIGLVLYSMRSFGHNIIVPGNSNATVERLQWLKERNWENGKVVIGWKYKSFVPSRCYSTYICQPKCGKLKGVSKYVANGVISKVFRSIIR